METLHVVCYRWGEKYGVDYVNRLYFMVSRHLSVPHQFHCITDVPDGLATQIDVHLLPPDHFNGNWNKLMTFQPDFLGVPGELVVCMDLDLVIVASIDFLADRPEADFLIARNWSKRGVRGNSSVYRLRVGSHPRVWEDFARAPDTVIDQFHARTRQGGDQKWLNHAIAHYDYFPDGKIFSFKRHCGAKGHRLSLPGGFCLSTARFGKARPPKGAAIIAFHGDPLPPDVANQPCGRWRHAPFVAQHWR